MNILGISAYYHDSAACLVIDGHIAAAAQEERFTRKKHDETFPKNAIDYCLNSQSLISDDLDYVAFYDKPLLKFERLLETYIASSPAGLPSFLKAMPVWVKEKIWTKEQIKKDLGYRGAIIFPDHHQSHAASAFFPSPFQTAAFLTVDGVGEWATTSFGIGQDNKIETLGEIHFPHSLGLLYSAFTYYTGFKVNSGEYKVMGLAPYGVPKYKDLILKELIEVKTDGSFRLNMKYFDFATGLRMTSPQFDVLFDGPARKPESKLTQKEMDLAASVQAVTDEIMILLSRHVKKITKSDYLCLAGGVALNCVANGKILRERIFKDIWIQPAAGDAGGSVGAALFTWHQYLGKPRKALPSDSMQGSYLGPEFSDSEIKEFLSLNKISATHLSNDKLTKKVAGLIADEKVVGWFQGRMEFGPRALGNRSILGDARSEKMQSVMNLKIKFRESFRPFAPSVLSEKSSKYFEIDRPSPYMLLVANVSKKHQKKMGKIDQKLFGIDKLNIPRSTVPAITHIDYSARLQTVNEKTSPLYHQLIVDFDKITGCPMIINTSFNVRGEPIVCTPEEAYTCFIRTGMDYLVLGNYLIAKKGQSQTKETEWQKEYQLD